MSEDATLKQLIKDLIHHKTLAQAKNRLLATLANDPDHLRSSYDSEKENIFSSPVTAEQFSEYLTHIPMQFLAGFSDENHTPALVEFLRVQLEAIKQELKLWEEGTPLPVAFVAPKKEKTEQKLRHVIEVFIKHSSLNKVRDTLSRDLTQASLSQLLQIQTHYLFLKRQLYNKSVSNEEVAAVLQTCPGHLITNQEKFVLVIDQNVRVLLNKQQQWESVLETQMQHLNKGWFNKLYSHSQKPIDFIYRSTIIGLLGELGQWSGKHTSAQIANTRAMNYLPFQNYVTATALGKTLGVGAGVYLVYHSGPYNVVKSLSINIFSMLLHNQLMNGRLNDRLASVEQSYRSPIGMTGIYRTAHLLAATGETLVTGRHHYLSYALGGFIGSIALTLCIKPFILPDGQSPTQEKVFLLFFLSMLGYDAGRWLSNVGIDAIAKILLISRAVKLLNDINITNNSTLWHSARSTHSRWSPSFWLTSQNKNINLQWASSSANYYETDCQALAAPNSSVSLFCSEPTPLLTRPLP